MPQTPQPDHDRLSPAPIDAQRWDDLARMLHGNADVLRDLVRTFVDPAQEEDAALRSAIDAADWPRMRRLAHRLKGSASALGALRLAQLCQELEQLADPDLQALAATTAARLISEHQAACGDLNQRTGRCPS